MELGLAVDVCVQFLLTEKKNRTCQLLDNCRVLDMAAVPFSIIIM